MRFINYEVRTGAENMQIDSDLLDEAIAKQLKEPIFRLYGWSPACVSLGRNQNDSFIDYDFLKSKNIDVVRRLTGGRALLHDNEITYSFVCPFEYLQNGTNVSASYKEISQILIDKFKTLDIDLMLGGEKGVHTKFDYCMLISTESHHTLFTYHRLEHRCGALCGAVVTKPVALSVGTCGEMKDTKRFVIHPILYLPIGR